MGLNIKDPEADRLARELAATTGESLTDAVLRALRERLSRQRQKVPTTPPREKLRSIRERCAALPVLDHRRPEEIIG